jgi:large subunit ribosomal protein L32
MVPTKKVSKCRTRTRRAHHALRVSNYTACPKCQSAKLPHCACGTCGYVSARVALPIKEKES